jgi:protein-S-isoprenylcysteine O-methyltransferase Ste14
LTAEYDPVGFGFHGRTRCIWPLGAIIVGEALLFGSSQLLLYAAIVMAGFHLFVIGYEEPFLRGRFGADYADFCRIVNRWIPLRPREPRP